MAPLPRKPGEVWSQVAFYAGLGFILPGGAVAGYVLGWFVDRWLHTAPILAVVLAFLGAAGGFVEVLRLLKQAEERAGEDESNKSSNGPGTGAS